MTPPSETLAALDRAIEMLVLCANKPNDERQAALLQALRDGLAGLERRLPDDGNGDEDAHNHGWNQCIDTLRGNLK